MFIFVSFKIKTINQKNTNPQQMRKLTTIFILFFGLSSTLFAHAQDCGHAGHKHSRNEIGISAGPLYAIDHEQWGTAFHLHYFRTLGAHSRWAIGGGFEQAWAGGNHFKIGAGVKYQLLNHLSLAVMPGVSFISHNAHHHCSHDHHDHHSHHSHHNHHDHKKAQFTLHFELVYDLIHWKNFHLGPVLDYSFTKNDSHAMIGLHLAYCF